MDPKEQEFLNQLKEAFAIEASEYLQTIVDGLLQLEEGVGEGEGEGEDLLEEIYRAAHSLKGASRAVNMSAIGAICQSLESIFYAMKQRQVVLETKGYDVLQRAMDMVSVLLQEGEDSQLSLKGIIEEIDQLALTSSKATLGKETPPKEREEDHLKDIKDPNDSSNYSDLTPTSLSSQREPSQRGAPSKRRGLETIRIPTKRLDTILLQLEEMITLKLGEEDLLLALEELVLLLESRKNNRATDRVTVTVTNDQEVLTLVERRSKELLIRLQDHHGNTTRLVDELLEDTKSIRMLPFSTLFKVLPKMVRDIAKEQEKEVDLIIEGEDLEVDRRILDELKDPLIHLLRNSIDHGLEKTKERQEKEKPKKGTLTIKISQLTGNKVQIAISDDGRGLDLTRLKERAIEEGLLEEEEALSMDDASAKMLIFQSGLTTSNQITSISGRGLGMAIVKESIENMGGSLSVETYLGEGTTFVLVVPITLANLQGILVKEWGRLFVIPTSSVERVLRISKEEIKRVESGTSIIFEERAIPIQRLGALLELDPDPSKAQPEKLFHVVILQARGEQMAFLLDQILREQEILLKDLGPQLKRVPTIAGATILGSKEVVPVLHVADLMGKAISSDGLLMKEEEERAKERRSILVVEDTIASRMLLTHILKEAGFSVEAAVNGEEAWRRIEEKNFDLIISDIEMPEMDGFALVERIRKESANTHLPVVLVTSLESEEDRKRGGEVGADAYLKKSSFQQGELLSVVNRLLGLEHG